MRTLDDVAKRSPGRWLAAGLAILALAPGLDRGAPEKIPPDKVVHPLLTGVSQPELIPESRRLPDYPGKWRPGNLGAQVILQGVVEKTGAVRDLAALLTKVWVVDSCDGESGKSTGKPPERTGSGDSRPAPPAKPAAPPEAANDFETAAIQAVKQWKYRPGTQNNAPVDVFYTIIVEFSPCLGSQPKSPQ
jgi:hypothetical protein